MDLAENENVSTLTEPPQRLANEHIRMKPLQPLPRWWNWEMKFALQNEFLITGGKRQLKIPSTTCSSSGKMEICCGLPAALGWEWDRGEEGSAGCQSCCVSLGAAAGQE